jgi:hypothetical protein
MVGAKIDLLEIANNTIEQAAREVIAHMLGGNDWLLDEKLREAVRERAREILKEPEMTEQIRASLSRWINKPEQEQRR